MIVETSKVSPVAYARLAGVLYVVIIVLGLLSEIAVRSSLVTTGDAATTAQNIMASEGLFRIGFLADSIMFLSDVALAVLLFELLKPVNKVLSLIAMCFRLTQSAVIALNLLHYYAAIIILEGASYASAFEEVQTNAIASLFLELHSYGYDLGLILFGIHCLVLGYLIARSLYMPKILGYLVMSAGMTYIVGSYTRFLFPDFVETLAPIYVVALVSEVSLCLWLLIKGVHLDSWQNVVGSTRTAAAPP